MKNCYFFQRSNQYCLLAQSKQNDDWFGYVGFALKHSYYGIGFLKIKSISLFKFPINDFLNTPNSIFKNLWWVGFCTNPYSKDKTLEVLKQLADDIAEELKKD